MKRTPFFFALAFASMLAFSCSDSKESATTEDAPATEQATPTEGAKPAQDLNAVARMSKQFTTIGIELTEEQNAQMNAISSQFDFKAAADRPARQALRTKFQNEVYAILTPEQQEIYNQKREERKSQ